jgi:hypothetical protein
LEAILTQLAEMRVGIGDIKMGEEDTIILHQKKALIISRVSAVLIP